LAKEKASGAASPVPSGSRVASAPSASRSPTMPRRSMLGIAAAAIGAVVGLVPLAAALLVFLDPLLRKNKKPLAYREGDGADNSLVRVATLDELPDDGVPRRFAVVADQIDAWNYMPNQPIGAVWIRRLKSAAPDASDAENDQGDGKKPKEAIQVFQATCPHAGCSVTYRPDAPLPGGVYHCPCHNSAFTANGTKPNAQERKLLGIEQNPSPRDMDPLEYDQDRLDQRGEVWIRFVNFYTGVPERREKT
jgi:menaquinol-cytochrome c reductase iron-sulfur subunit